MRNIKAVIFLNTLKNTIYHSLRTSFIYFFFFFFFHQRQCQWSFSWIFPKLPIACEIYVANIGNMFEIPICFSNYQITPISVNYSEYKSRGYVWFVVICITGNFKLFPPKLFPISFSFLVSLTQGIHFFCLFLSVIWLRLKVNFGPFAKRSFIH